MWSRSAAERAREGGTGGSIRIGAPTSCSLRSNRPPRHVICGHRLTEIVEGAGGRPPPNIWMQAYACSTTWSPITAGKPFNPALVRELIRRLEGRLGEVHTMLMAEELALVAMNPRKRAPGLGMRQYLNACL